MADANEIDLAALSDDELVEQMHNDLYDGLADEIVEGTKILLGRGWAPTKVLDDALVADLPGPEVLGDEVERRDLVPGGRERVLDCQCLVPVLDQLDLASAVVGVLSRDGGHADLLVVDDDPGPGRVAADRHASAHTPGGRGGH